MRGGEEAMGKHVVLRYELPNNSQLVLHGRKWESLWMVWQELLFLPLYVFPLLPEFLVIS